MSADEFAPASREDWEAAAQKITKGVPTDEAISKRTRDDILIRPLYDAADLTDDFDQHAELFKSRGWDIYQLYDYGDGIDFKAIKADGADGVWLRTTDKLEAGNLVEVLEGLSLFLDAGPFGFEVAEAILEVWGSGKSNFRNLSLTLDPLGTLARYGQLSRKPEDAIEALAEFVAQARQKSNKESSVIAVGVDTSVYSEAGATEAEQLSFALATGAMYLESLKAGGIEDPASQIEFTIAVTPEMFQNIALLRAFRICWQKVLKEAGEKGTTKLNAVTSPSYLAGQDVWTNLLRTTGACFGAALGGANTITVLPHDYWHTLKNGNTKNTDAQRLAANVSHLLQQESHLGRVSDPSRGSYYLESFTASLVEASWERYLEIQNHGSMLRMLTEGMVQKILESSWRSQSDKEKIIIGVNEYLNPLEEGVEAKFIEYQPELLANPAFEITALVPQKHSLIVRNPSSSL